MLFLTIALEVEPAGAAAVAASLGDNYGVEAVLQVSGNGALPFGAAEQTALLVALNNLLPSR